MSQVLIDRDSVECKDVICSGSLIRHDREEHRVDSRRGREEEESRARGDGIERRGNYRGATGLPFVFFRPENLRHVLMSSFVFSRTTYTRL